MSNLIPTALINETQKNHDEILRFLLKKGYKIPEIPSRIKGKKDSGEAFTLAYPIQGVLKYHGFANPEHRIAYFPSISLNNSCAYTISYLRFDRKIKEYSAYLNGKQVIGDELERIKYALEVMRRSAHIKTKAVLISRNFYESSESDQIGKGLGTSAGGASALALAAVSIIYDNDPIYINNKRLISVFSRYFSGSGTRSATGGFSLWLSHPKIDPFDCFAIRLDRKEHQSFIKDISLITIPIKSDLKTNQAHEIAPKSPFFITWLKYRKKLIYDFINALDNHDLNKIGELAEYDSACLNAVSMTAPGKQNIIAWEPETIRVMHQVRKLRKEGYNVYYSIDTGPSLVLLTNKKEKNKIINEIKPVIPDHNILEGKIGGPCELLSPNSRQAKKLENDIKKFINF